MTIRPLSLALFLPHLDVCGGLGVHCRMLVAALNAVPSEYHFTIISPADPAANFPTTGLDPFDRRRVDGTRFAFRSVTIPPEFSLANPLDSLLSTILADVHPDLVYCSYYTGMQSPPCPQVVTFHDAGFLDNPEGFGPTAALRRQTLASIAPAVDLIHCISHDARDRICRALPWPREDTAVVWHALPDAPALLATALASSRADVRFSLEDRPYFFLPVGAATGFNRVRKNVPTAIRAFEQLPSGAARLVIAGTAQLTAKVLAELLPPDSAGNTSNDGWISADGSISIVPTLDRDAFLSAMRHAIAVVYPSRYEGFGLPTLEAFALGVPLIAAAATSIPEIVGDAGLLVEPDDVAGFREAMRAMLEQPESRSDLIRRGRERVKRFTLETMGAEMVQVFQSIPMQNGL